MKPCLTNSYWERKEMMARFADRSSELEDWILDPQLGESELQPPEKNEDE